MMPGRSASAASRRRGQRGSIALVAAAALSAALIAAAVAVDLGRAYYVRRDLQKAADMASLSAVSDLSQAQAIGLRIARDNGFDGDAAATEVEVVPGVYDEGARVFTPGGDAASRNAAEVTVRNHIPYFFLPGGRDLSATGVATRSDIAGFQMGSFLARLDSSSSPLLNSIIGGLLGGTVNLDLVSYQGLAAGSVSAAGLGTALGLGTTSELLAANLSLQGLADAMITALDQQGDAASLAAATVLGNLRGSIDPGLALQLGELLQLQQDAPQAALDARINALQLLLLAAQVANGEHFIQASPGLSLPGIASVNIALTVVEPPVIAIGPARSDGAGGWVTRAHSAQVRLRLDLRLLGAVGGGVVNLPIYVEAGAADGSLTGIQCRSPLDDSTVNIETQTSAVVARIGTVGNAAMQNTSSPVTVAPASVLNLTLLGLPVLRVYAAATGQVAARTEQLAFNGPFDFANTRTTASTSLGLGSLLGGGLTLTPEVLGILPLPLGDILGQLNFLLLPLLGTVDGLLIDPILSLLGVGLGGADVTAFTLECGNARLVR